MSIVGDAGGTDGVVAESVEHASVKDADETVGEEQ